MKKKLSPARVGIWLCVAALPLAGLVHMARAYHTATVLSHYFSGRAANCDLRESFQSEALSRLQNENVNFMKAGSRVVERDETYSRWHTPAGDYWMPTKSGDALVYDLAEQKRNIYGTHIHPGDVVLDAGANVGVFTRKALWAGAALVVAIEPAPENLECLRRNFAAEIAAHRVVLYPKGVWDKDDVLQMKVDPTNSAKDTFVRAIDNAQYVALPLTTIDKLVAELSLPRVDFIKMDIEGAERRAIAGGRNTIARFRPRMALCIYHVAGDEVEVPKLVHDAEPGYTVSKTCLCGSDRIEPEVAFFY